MRLAARLGGARPRSRRASVRYSAEPAAIRGPPTCGVRPGRLARGAGSCSGAIRDDPPAAAVAGQVGDNRRPGRSRRARGGSRSGRRPGRGSRPCCSPAASGSGRCPRRSPTARSAGFDDRDLGLGSSRRRAGRLDPRLARLRRADVAAASIATTPAGSTYHVDLGRHVATPPCARARRAIDLRPRSRRARASPAPADRARACGRSRRRRSRCRRAWRSRRFRRAAASRSRRASAARTATVAATRSRCIARSTATVRGHDESSVEPSVVASQADDPFPNAVDDPSNDQRRARLNPESSRDERGKSRLGRAGDRISRPRPGRTAIGLASSTPAASIISVETVRTDDGGYDRETHSRRARSSSSTGARWARPGASTGRWPRSMPCCSSRPSRSTPRRSASCST